jgi:hypothetical protein
MIERIADRRSSCGRYVRLLPRAGGSRGGSGLGKSSRGLVGGGLRSRASRELIAPMRSRRPSKNASHWYQYALFRWTALAAAFGASSPAMYARVRRSLPTGGGPLVSVERVLALRLLVPRGGVCNTPRQNFRPKAWDEWDEWDGKKGWGVGVNRSSCAFRLQWCSGMTQTPFVGRDRSRFAPGVSSRAKLQRSSISMVPQFWLTTPPQTPRRTIPVQNPASGLLINNPSSKASAGGEDAPGADGCPEFVRTVLGAGERVRWL